MSDGFTTLRLCYAMLKTFNSRRLAVIVHPLDVSDPECFGERQESRVAVVNSVGCLRSQA